MRAALIAAVLAAPASARADAIGLAASVGAGAQGTASYGAIELRLDAAWPGVRIGLGARGVWEDAVFRRADWARAADLVTIVRLVELAGELGEARLALAAGELAPARVGRIADGYRATLDDRWRTGVRARAAVGELEVGAEIDDVLDPALVAAAARWQMAPPWGVHAALALDPGAIDAGSAGAALEAGVHRRVEAAAARAEAGVSLVAEPGLGASAVGFGGGAIERGGVRWSARADLRGGTGSVGALFGPLYRAERQLELGGRARAGELAGVGAGAAIGAALLGEAPASTPVAWLELGARRRPGLGGLLHASAGAPMGRWVQGALWLARGRDAAAGAAELRVAWVRRLFSAFQVARIYQLDAMEPEPRWSLTAWFGASTD